MGRGAGSQLRWRRATVLSCLSPGPGPAHASFHELPAASFLALSMPTPPLLGVPRLKQATHGCGGSSAPAQVTLPLPPAPPATGQARDRNPRNEVTSTLRWGTQEGSPAWLPEQQLRVLADFSERSSARGERSQFSEGSKEAAHRSRI